MEKKRHELSLIRESRFQDNINNNNNNANVNGNGTILSKKKIEINNNNNIDSNNLNAKSEEMSPQLYQEGYLNIDSIRIYDFNKNLKLN